MSNDNPLSDRFDPPEKQEETTKDDTVNDTGNTPEMSEGDNASKTDNPSNPDSEKRSNEGSASDTRRDRPHTAMYISADLVDRMKTRYRKINGELMINEGEEIELNKHFYEGLIKAGLEHPDLEEIVLEQREKNSTIGSCVQFGKILTGCRSNPNAVDVVYVEVHRGCSVRVVFDEHAMDYCLDGSRTIFFHDLCHCFVQVRVLMIRSWILGSLEHKCNNAIY